MPYKNPEDKKAQNQRWSKRNPDYHRSWRENNPDYMRNYMSRYNRIQNIKKYGLNPDEVPEVLVCELCGSTNRVAFDHCHKTGKFRGWLCIRCNTFLGQVKDNADLLKRMVVYLQK